MLRVTTRNARFQQWQALLGNRKKRQHAGEFLVHGVRPITMAVQHGWPIRALLCQAEAPPSRWAADLREQLAQVAVSVSPELMHELGEKAEAPPELIAVAGMPDDRLNRIRLGRHAPVVVLDRPASPGNLGTVIRAADAFGAAGVVVTGHAADLYDPRTVRASTGSLFTVPAVRAPGPDPVRGWMSSARTRGLELRAVGAVEHGDLDAADADLTGATLLVIGNETSGLSGGWRQACESLVRIPIAGSASSLNAATAAAVLLYETSRQHRRPERRTTTQ